jgi:hypothetical protein
MRTRIHNTVTSCSCRYYFNRRPVRNTICKVRTRERNYGLGFSLKETKFVDPVLWTIASLVHLSPPPPFLV